MGKTVIVTSGPTNERIDSVMKITNMSTGALGSMVAETLAKKEEIDKIYYISPRLARKPDFSNLSAYMTIKSGNIGAKITYIAIESAEDLLKELTMLLSTEHIDAVVHSAAVGDYKAKYSVRGESLANEISDKIKEAYDDNDGILDTNMMRNIILDVLDNPDCISDDSGKMSSYEPMLMTMMTLTPKVIGCIKKTSPSTLLIGFKLLDGVTNDELYDVANRLREKNDADYIIANDLSRIGNGKHWAMVVGKDGILQECQDKNEIAQIITKIILSKRRKQL